MPDPLTTSLLVSAGSSAVSSLLGGGVNALFNERPEIPDLSSEVAGKYDEAKRQLDENLQKKTDQVQADAAAAGVNPISAMGDVIDANNDAQADLMSKKKDAISRAENRENMMKFRRGQEKYKARAQGIGSIVNSLSQAGTALGMREFMGEDDGSGDGGGGGNGDGGSNGGGIGSNLDLGGLSTLLMLAGNKTPTLNP